MTEKELERIFAKIMDIKLDRDALATLLRAVKVDGGVVVCANVFGKPWFEIRDEMLSRDVGE